MDRKRDILNSQWEEELELQPLAALALPVVGAAPGQHAPCLQLSPASSAPLAPSGTCPAVKAPLHSFHLIPVLFFSLFLSQSAL